MLNNDIINKLNEFFKSYLNIEHNPLKRASPNLYRFEGSHAAINFRNNDPIEVYTYNWFEDFYLFVEIKFIEEHTWISTSLFYGDKNAQKKHQLFRAEWDDLKNENEPHPQPHWHITRDRAVKENFGNISFNPDEHKYDPVEILDLSSLDIFDTRNIHFAMASDWHNENSPVHLIDDADKIVNWFRGMLDYIRVELTT